jgi:aryl carrier-like protein
MMSGDWIAVSLPGRMRKLADEELQILSLGGATEAAIWSIFYPIEQVEEGWKSIPYGKPLTNQKFHVLKENGEMSPEWVPGQLYIGGVGLARGYWRDEEKTRERFRWHAGLGERLYWTGDLGRYLPEGNIEFLGREDAQVKIQGFRIELGEIESALRKHAGVQEALVTVVGSTGPGAKRLVAYVVPHKIDAPSLAEPANAQVLKDVNRPLVAAVNEAELREHLQRLLPAPLIPAHCIMLDALPLSANGKVDRKALPPPEDLPSASTSFVAPGTELEQQIASAVAEELKIDRVGLQENFFDLGATSVNLVRVNTRLGKQGLAFPIVELFQYPTVAALSRRLTNSRQEAEVHRSDEQERSRKQRKARARHVQTS